MGTTSVDSVLHNVTMNEETSSSSVLHNMAIDQSNEASWITLWAGFAIASIFTAWQVRRTMTARPHSDIEHGGVDGGTSSGDATRQIFYKLLLVALLSRFLLLPVQAWATDIWWQFAADTFPLMTFASAWALLVSFFVQLVEAASGEAADSGNSLWVMQAIAYTMYGALVLLYVWNDAAILLLYALLCCVYAALFATLVYFGPKLLTLLKPSLVQRSGLAFRLVACSLACLLVFGARTVTLAQKVLLMSKPGEPSWWYNYGLLELFPAVALLIMMQKSRQRSSSGGSNSPNAAAGTTPPSATSIPSPSSFLQRSPSDKGLPPMMSKAHSQPPTAKSEVSSLLPKATTTTTGISYGSGAALDQMPTGLSS